MPKKEVSAHGRCFMVASNKLEEEGKKDKTKKGRGGRKEEGKENRNTILGSQDTYAEDRL